MKFKLLNRLTSARKILNYSLVSFKLSGNVEILEIHANAIFLLHNFAEFFLCILLLVVKMNTSIHDVAESELFDTAIKYCLTFVEGHIKYWYVFSNCLSIALLIVLFVLNKVDLTLTDWIAFQWKIIVLILINVVLINIEKWFLSNLLWYFSYILLFL